MASAAGIAVVPARRNARAAIFVFVVCFTVLDAIGGTGLGRTITTVESLVTAGKLNPLQVEGIELLLDIIWADRWVGGVGSLPRPVAVNIVLARLNIALRER